jgi:hypothetical protein
MQNSLKVKTGLKAGKISTNHARAGLKVRTAIKGGRIAMNHARVLFAV